MPFDIKTTRTVTAERVTNLFCSSFEGSYSPWLNKVRNLSGEPVRTPDEKGYPWYSIPAYVDGDFAFEVTYDDPNAEEDDDGNPGQKTMTLKRADIERGLEVLASKYPKHFADLMDENDDALTADLYMQCIVFGEEVYC
jgi:hypothetical protein